MAIRKFIEEIGEKILPTRRHSLPVAGQQQQQQAGGAAGQHGAGPRRHFGRIYIDESAQAIRRYLQARREFDAPSDLVVLFNEMDAVVILGGTVRDEATREAIVLAAGNIHGVERVDDRMVHSPRAAW